MHRLLSALFALVKLAVLLLVLVPLAAAAFGFWCGMRAFKSKGRIAQEETSD
jgi:hypothetical protein